MRQFFFFFFFYMIGRTPRVLYKLENQRKQTSVKFERQARIMRSRHKQWYDEYARHKTEFYASPPRSNKSYIEKPCYSSEQIRTKNRLPRYISSKEAKMAILQFWIIYQNSILKYVPRVYYVSFYLGEIFRTLISTLFPRIL